MSRVRSKLSFANVMAVIAVFLALGGASYAAFHLPKKSVGTKQIKNGAVTLVKINPSAQAALKGQTPIFGVTSTGSASDPSPGPDMSVAQSISNQQHLSFSLPSAGNVYLQFFSGSMGANCSSGAARAGLYLDGNPVPGTGKVINTAAAPSAENFVGITHAGVGNHTADVLDDCPVGPLGSFVSDSTSTWSALLLGG